MARKVLYVNQHGKKGTSTPKGVYETSSISLNHPKKNTLTGKKTPNKKNIDKAKKKFYLNYNIDSKFSMNDIIKKLHKSLSIIDNANASAESVWLKNVKSYNRFKLPTANDALQRGFAHVFFVRPDCNILTSGMKLTKNIQNKQIFSYAFKKSPQLVKELVINNGSTHDFMLSLSNKATSFSPNDEYINTDTYGESYTGYKIAYGKGSGESKTAGTLSINYKDDREGHVLLLHRLWIEYINGVYRGVIIPKTSTILDKILDYGASCYYIVTAEDNETIIFWSKYYGVFPTNIPSDQYAWSHGNFVRPEDITIQYMYSFKEDYNPMAIVEFNRNSRVYGTGATYAKTFNKSMNQVGPSWVGAPFIELVTNNSDVGCEYTYKLRFKNK